MRRFHKPFEGFVRDSDMAVYFRLDDVPTVGGLFSETYYGTRELYASTDADAAPSIYDPQSLTGAGSFDRADPNWYRTETPLNDHQIFNGSGGSTRWGAAFWYDFTTAATTGCVFEYGINTEAAGGTQNHAVGVYWSAASQAFHMTWQDSSGDYYTLGSGVVPASGLLGLDVASANSIRLDWFHNGRQVSTATLSKFVGPNVASTSSARWSVGASVLYGTNYSVPGLGLTGRLDEFAVWGRALGAQRHQSLYGQSVRNWDEQDLIESRSQKVLSRVLIEDSAGVMQDMSCYDGMDWLVAADITEDVDNSTNTMKLTLRRRRGKFSDLSPLNTETEITSLLGLRRRVRLDRAVVPALHQIQGWEWETRFEGLISRWGADEHTMDIDVDDLGCSLEDAFIMDPRAYNYATVNKAGEAVQEQILDDYEPALKSASSETTVGYKGFGAGSRPRLYTEAGSSFTPQLLPSNFLLRFNDVQSGSVLNAVQAVTDQIGFDTRFRYHDPWSGTRLTSYSPRRDFEIPHRGITRLTPQTLQIDFLEPHGLSRDVPITVSGTASFDFSQGQVDQVLDYYSLVARKSTASFASGTTTGGSVSFNYHLAVDADDVMEVSPAELEIGGIRNHAVVKYARMPTPAEPLGLSLVSVTSGILTMTTFDNISNVDIDGNGVPFTLSGGTAGSAVLNGTYSGHVVGSHTLIADVPNPSASNGSYSNNLPNLYIETSSFREYVSTASTSVAEYGLLPVAVYEGSNLAINTLAEAQRLADSLISDLSAPTVNMTLTMMNWPLELHDVLRLPSDPKGRWTGTLDVAIVGIRESYKSGDCYAEYDVRAQKPTRGTKWAARIIVDTFKPAVPNNYALDILGQASDRLKLGSALKGARQIGLVRNGIQRREMGRRHDQTRVWLSTGSAGFIPSQANLVGSFRGETMDLQWDGSGNALTPGTTYFMRMADVDIFGNVSQITGLGSASAATVPAFVPRFLDLTSSAQAVTGGTTTYLHGPTYTTPFCTVESYDNFGQYTPTSQLFQAQCDGIYNVSLTGTFITDKVGVSLGFRVGRFNGSMATLSFTNEQFTPSRGTGITFRSTFDANVYCNSGDFMKVELADTNSGHNQIRCSTACSQFTQLNYSLIHQK